MRNQGEEGCGKSNKVRDISMRIDGIPKMC